MGSPSMALCPSIGVVYFSPMSILQVEGNGGHTLPNTIDGRHVYPVAVHPLDGPKIDLVNDCSSSEKEGS
jgi:hypothetical protein